MGRVQVPRERGPGGLAAPFAELLAQLADRLAKVPARLNEFGYDPYGFHPQSARHILLPAALLYRYWFRVEPHDIERVPLGRVLLIANHSGQFGYDGTMLGMAMLLAAEPPRLARAMGEYFLWRTPFMGWLASRMGTMVGTPDNCIAMLREGECVMVLPEGARGANKPWRKRYQLQRFGTGFLRIALETDTPIVPVGIVGAEEQQPGFANLEDLGRRFNLPSFPLTVSQPWFGPLGAMFALPVKYHLWFGELLRFRGDPHDDDAVIERHVEVVKEAVRALIARGLRRRRGIFT